MHVYRSLSPVTVEDLMLRTGWSQGPDGDSIVDEDGNQAFVIEEPDGRLLLEAEDGTDLSVVLSEVPFERVERDLEGGDDP